jgi:hypothetical protein
MAANPALLGALLQSRGGGGGAPAPEAGLAGPGAPPAPAPTPGGGDITLPDTLGDSLANANKHLRAMMEQNMPMPPDAIEELHMFGRLLNMLGERDQASAAGPAGMPGGTSPAGPGPNAPAAPPGPLG